MSIVIANQQSPQQLPLQTSLDDLLPEDVIPDDVRFALSRLGEKSIIILDEVDRLEDVNAKRLMADTIKNLSDHAGTVNATIVLVGGGFYG